MSCDTQFQDFTRRFSKHPFSNKVHSAGNDEGEEIATLIAKSKILVVGAGGLGNQIIKALVMSGVKNIDLLDVDTMEVSNLNRQILFRDGDVGGYKAEIAASRASKVMQDYNVTIVPRVALLQTFPLGFFSQFDAVIAGLDNIEARRWLNNALCQLVQFKEVNGIYKVDPLTVIPLIDGGSEGFMGHCRVIIPAFTSCFECTLSLFPPERSIPMCTIIDRPRMPEHCIKYALLICWEKDRKDKNPDFDEDEDIEWLYMKAKERADQFNVSGVTKTMTRNVLKRIVPAIAATNQIIGGLVVHETLKVLIGTYPVASTYIMYNGLEGTCTSSHVLAKDSKCVVCSELALLGISADFPLIGKLRQFVDQMLPSLLNVTKPTIRSDNGILYPSLPDSFRVLHEFKLEKTFADLQEDGHLPSGVNSKLIYALITMRWQFF